MAATQRTVTIPIYARLDRKEFHIGDLELPVKFVGGKVKGPSSREIVAVMRKARF